MKTLSIIIVTLNCEDRIASTLSSLACQDERVEVIILDGLSQDNTVRIVKENLSILPSPVFISESDNGIYDAMNKGISLASGNWIYFLNAGDVLLEGLENILDILASSRRLDIVLFSICRDTVDILPASRPSSRNFFIYNSICHQAAIVKKTLYLEMNCFDLKYRFVSDQLFFLRAFDAKAKFAIFPYVLCDWPSEGFCLKHISEYEDERREFVLGNYSPWARILASLERLYDLKLKRRLSCLLSRLSKQ